MSRQYEIADIGYPSVTTILGLLDKPFLLPWAAEQAAKYVMDNLKSEPGVVHPDHAISIIDGARTAYQKVSGDAKYIGSDVHQLLELHLNIKIHHWEKEISLRDYCDEVKNCYAQFLLWEEKYQPKWTESEKTVVNPMMGYAGTLDAVAEIDGKQYVIDFKTDKQISDTYPMQISAYQEAWNCMKEPNGDLHTVTCQGILRLPKDGSGFEWVDYSDKFYNSLAAFEGLLTYYYYAKKRRLKNNPIVAKIWAKQEELT